MKRLYKWSSNSSSEATTYLNIKRYRGVFVLCLGSFLMSSGFVSPGYGDNVPPSVSVDLGDNENGGDSDNVEVLQIPGSYVTYNADASNASTDQPDSSKGCPPWTKTQNKRFIWYVSKTDGNVGTSVDGGDEEAGGDATTEPSMEVYLDDPGTVNIKVGFQEEYQDSSPSPKTIYWPE